MPKIGYNSHFIVDSPPFVLIRICLLLISCAFAAFIASDVLLRLGLPWLPETITQLGLFILLLAFGALIVSGLALIGRQVAQAVKDYFSGPQTRLRKLLFAQNRQLELARRFQAKKWQLGFVYENRRRRLLAADNQKSFDALAKAVRKDLRLLKKRSPKDIHQQWRRELSHCQRRQDSGALLNLQQKIAAWNSR